LLAQAPVAKNSALAKIKEKQALRKEAGLKDTSVV
jgi:hypothetical protein